VPGATAMAIAAANLTLGDLRDQRREPTAAPGKLSDVPALDADMIELQDHEPSLPTVGAAGLHEEVPNVSHVAPLPPCEIFGLVHRHRIKTPGVATARGPYAVTVHADDLAIRDLTLYATTRGTLGDEQRQICVLGADVVEFQNQRVTVTAVETGMPFQVVLDVGAGLLSSTNQGVSALISMQLASRPEVRPIAVATPPLVALGVPVEAGERQISTATAASPVTGLGLGGGLRRASRLDGHRRRQGDISDPDAHRGQRHAKLVGDSPQGPPSSAQLSCSDALTLFATHANTCSLTDRTETRLASPTGEPSKTPRGAGD
jgi:hypothetical protein